MQPQAYVAQQPVQGQYRAAAPPAASRSLAPAAQPLPPAAAAQPAAPPAPVEPIRAADNAVAEQPARRPVQLPPSDFVYINRPLDQFVDRWKALYQVIIREVATPESGKEFLMCDIGSHTGYFSLNVSQHFPASTVISVEGSVGVGNSDVGRTTADWTKIAETSAIRTHLKWIDTLELENNTIAPEVWRLDRIQGLKRDGFFADVLLLFSVVHHIDGVCEDQYKQLGLNPVQGTLKLMRGLFDLANVVVVELANKPWIQHMHDAYPSQQAILAAACQETGDRWTMQRVYQNEWFGTRDLWVLCRVDRKTSSLSAAERKKLFPTHLGVGDARAAPVAAQPAPRGDGADLVGDLSTAPASHVNLDDVTGSPEELADIIEEATALLLDSRAIKAQSYEFMKSLDAQRQSDAAETY